MNIFLSCNGNDTDFKSYDFKFGVSYRFFGANQTTSLSRFRVWADSTENLTCGTNGTSATFVRVNEKFKLCNQKHENKYKHINTNTHTHKHTNSPTHS